MVATHYRQTNKVFWWKLTSCPSHTSCAEVRKANIYHLIKGYDLLTLELVLMASKSRALKSCCYKQGVKLVKSFLCNLGQVAWGFFCLFVYFLTLCSPESHAVVVGRNYRSFQRIYSSATASDAEHLG